MTTPSKSIIQKVPWLSSPQPQALYWAGVTALVFTFAGAIALMCGTNPGDFIQIIILLSVGLGARQVWLVDNPTKVGGEAPMQERIP